MSPQTLLFTDVVDSTKIVQQLGDEAAAALWADHDRVARALLAKHSGLEIDRSDGFFLLFDDVVDAAQFARGYHAAIASMGIAARVGIHHGAMTLRQNPPEAVARGAKPLEVEGLAKPLAARVMALAAGGQTLLSGEAAAALQPHLPAGQQLRCHGHYRLKGIEGPLALSELGDERCGFVPPADAEKAYRVVADGELWKPVREVRHNLAPERDGFVGRAAELRALAERLDGGARLLTVLGPGGIGKTRLVRRYSHSWLGDWPGGIYFCDLSESRSLDGIHFAVALALSVPLGKDDACVRLGHAIAGRGRCLVILDNFEQVLEYAGATLGRWLDRAAEAAFVVTSRERLHLQGEVVFSIEPLALTGEALELFVLRARAQHPDFALGEGNRAAVAEVVRLLDGLPLAIELAAARTRVLAPQQLVDRMKDRFALLADARGSSARQATLKAAIDWSWEMLAPWEQAAMAQCSMFEGGFTLEAAESVLDLSTWPAAPPALDTIQSLVDKSLLRSWLPAQQTRVAIDEPFFGMYLSIHDYAAQKLAATGAQAHRAAQQRHGRYFATLGTDDAIDALTLRGGARRRHLMALDIDNLLAAARRAVAAQAADVAAASCRAALEVLQHQGPLGPGMALAAQVRTMDIDATLRVPFLMSYGRALGQAGRLEEAQSALAEALRLAHAAHDRRREGRALGALGFVYRELGRMDAAQEVLAAALAIAREQGDRVTEGHALEHLGGVHRKAGRAAEALASYEAALAVYRDQGSRLSEGSALGNIANVLHLQGRYDEAVASFRRALDILREAGSRHSEGIGHGNLGTVFHVRGQFDEARASYEAALAIHREIGSRNAECYVLCNLSDLHQQQGRLAQGVDTGESALAICREVGDHHVEGHLLGALGVLYRHQGRPQEALAHLRQGLAVLRQTGNRRIEGCAQGWLGDLLCSLEQTEEGVACFRAGEARLREVGDRIELAKLLCRRGHVDAGRGDRSAAKEALAEAQDTATAIGASRGSDLARLIDELRTALA